MKTHSKGKPPEFSNVQLLSKLAFVVYITEKLNCLNGPSGPVTRLQGFGGEKNCQGRKIFVFIIGLKQIFLGTTNFQVAQISECLSVAEDLCVIANKENIIYNNFGI